jgi:hypothetical protein
MLQQYLLPGCLFFKGEAICPSQYDGKNTGKLWEAEKFVYENLHDKISKNDAERELAQWVSYYVQKWSPYKYEIIMDDYFKHRPYLKSKLL